MAVSRSRKAWLLFTCGLVLAGAIVGGTLLSRERGPEDLLDELVGKGDVRDGKLRLVLNAAGVTGWPRRLDFVSEESRYWAAWTHVSEQKRVLWCRVVAPITQPSYRTGTESYLFMFDEQGKILLSLFDNMDPFFGFVDIDRDGVAERVVCASSLDYVSRARGFNSWFEVYRFMGGRALRIFRVLYQDQYTQEPNADPIVPEVAYGDETVAPRIVLKRGRGPEGEVLARFSWDPQKNAITGPAGGPDRLWHVEVKNRLRREAHEVPKGNEKH